MRLTHTCYLLALFIILGPVSRARSADFVGVARLQKEPPFNVPHPLLTRELVRQAILIAARDGLGLSTRDEVLGEPVRAGHTLTLVPDFDFTNIPIEFRLLSDGQTAPLYETAFEGHLWLGRPQDAVPLAEAMSRNEFVAAIRKVGVDGRPNATDAAGPLDPVAAGALERPELLTQWAAVRLVHDQVRANGESPARLAALARGYANLWQLSAFVWGGSPKAMAARALLYGQRAVVRFPNDATALVGRAYAEALVGLPKQALADLDAAKAISGTEAWRDRLVRDLCAYDAGALVADADADPAHAAWAELFAFLTVEHSGAQAAVINFAQSALGDIPDSQRLIAAINVNSGPGLANWASEAGGTAFAQTMGQADTLPGLPQDIAQMVRDLRRPGGNAGGRTEVIAALRKAGVADPAEPSWQTLARLIEDVTFMNVEQRAWHIQKLWGNDPNDFLDEQEPFVAGHRYHGFLDLVRAAHGTDAEAYQTKFRSLVMQDPTYAMFPISGLWNGTDARPLASHAGWNGEINNGDFTAFDIDFYAAAFRFDLKDKVNIERATRHLEQVAPDSPTRAAIKINADWDAAAREVDVWLRASGDHPTLTLAVARHYLAANDFARAEPLLEKYVAVSPDYAGYHALAACYFHTDGEKKYLDTVDRFLKVPDPGLQHASVEIEVTNYFLERDRGAEALPYARAAAETGSAAGLDAYARVAEATGDWSAAEQAVVESGEHYGKPLDWPMWCLRTGHGDADAALRKVRAYERVLRTRTDRESYADHVIALMILDDTRAAEALAVDVTERTNDPWVGLAGVVLAAGRRDDAMSDRLLAELTDPARPFHMPDGSGRPALVGLAAYLQELRRTNAPPDIDRLTKLVTPDPAGDAANVYYFAAKWAQAKGQNPATALLKRAADTPSLKMVRTFAIRELRAATTRPTTNP